MKIFVLVLTLAVSALARSQGGQQQPQSIDSPQGADQYIDQLLQSAGQDQDADSAEMDDVQFQFQQQKPPHAQGQVKLSQGQLSGITSQAQRDGQSQVQKQGSKQQIQTPIKFKQLQVQYQQVDIQTQPDQGMDADSLQGQLQNVKAILQVEYDQQSGEASLRGLQVQQAQQSQYTFEGAEQQQKQNPEMEQQADQQIQKAAAKALRKQMQKILEEASQSSK